MNKTFSFFIFLQFWAFQLIWYTMFSYTDSFHILMVGWFLNSYLRMVSKTVYGNWFYVFLKSLKKFFIWSNFFPDPRSSWVTIILAEFTIDSPLKQQFAFTAQCVTFTLGVCQWMLAFKALCLKKSY